MLGRTLHYLFHIRLLDPLRVRVMQPLRSRFLYPLRDRTVYFLDHFLGWPPFVQVFILILLTALLIGAWGLLYLLLAGDSHENLLGSLWWAVTRFMDGGTLAQDWGKQYRVKALSIGVTGFGVVLLAFLTGSFASKLSERIEDLRSGRSPVVERRHVLLLGFDARAFFVARELGRSHRRLKLVVLAAQDKPRAEALLRRSLHQVPGSRVRPICRIGDPHSGGDLMRLGAAQARAIIVIAPPQLSDEAARRWLLLTLLCVRHVVGSEFRGPVVVDARRAGDRPVLELVGESGLCSPHRLPVKALSSDDIIALVLAHSARQAGVYFVLRELLSFQGNEIYLEPLPRGLEGRTFDEAHERTVQGIAIGVMRADGTHRLVPAPGDPTPLSAGDRLIVVEEEWGTCRLGGSLPAAEAGLPQAAPEGPQHLVVLGANRTLPCLVTELCRVLPAGSQLTLCCPGPLWEGREVQRAVGACAGHTIRHEPRPLEDIVRVAAPFLFEADGVIILGCEDELDPDGDASALELLLQLRHAQRDQGARIRRLVTEVRDPRMAQQIRVTPSDFLVGTDVVAMVLARAALAPQLSAVYREIFDPAGAEIFLRPRSLYAAGPANFAGVMAAARRRGEIAIGFYPGGTLDGAARREVPLAEGQPAADEWSPVRLNPPRDTQVPEGPEVSIVVLGQQ